VVPAIRGTFSRGEKTMSESKKFEVEFDHIEDARDH
jgi:hypothetical protein